MAEFQPINIAENYLAGKGIRQREQANALAMRAGEQDIADRQQRNAHRVVRERFTHDGLDDFTHLGRPVLGDRYRYLQGGQRADQTGALQGLFGFPVTDSRGDRETADVDQLTDAVHVPSHDLRALFEERGDPALELGAPTEWSQRAIGEGDHVACAVDDRAHRGVALFEP